MVQFLTLRQSSRISENGQLPGVCPPTTAELQLRRTPCQTPSPSQENSEREQNKQVTNQELRVFLKFWGNKTLLMTNAGLKLKKKKKRIYVYKKRQRNKRKKKFRATGVVIPSTVSCMLVLDVYKESFFLPFLL